MLSEYAARYRRELLESVAPFWLKNAVDRECGGFFSCLDRAGKVYDTRKYVWLQGRAVWMFSRLYNELERRPEWLEPARCGAAFIRQHARDPQGRCYFSLSREGQPVSYQRKPYAAVFVMMGLLEYSRASGDESPGEEAIALFWDILKWIEEPSLMGRPVYAGQPPLSKLADVMVVAMMALELVRVHHDPRYDGLLRLCLQAAMKHCEPQRMILLEHVTPDGAFLFDTPDGRFFNPGHSIEVAWFLLHLLRHNPDPHMQRKVLDIIEGTLEFGWDNQHGGLYYFMDVEGKPMLPLESSMKLWWPHTEALYAVILASTTSHEKRWLKWLERLDQFAFRRFADPVHGEWFGYCDRQGNVTNTCKGNNYKGFYHLPRFLLMSVQEIEKHAAAAAAS